MQAVGDSLEQLAAPAATGRLRDHTGEDRLADLENMGLMEIAQRRAQETLPETKPRRPAAEPGGNFTGAAIDVEGPYLVGVGREIVLGEWDQSGKRC